MALNKHSARSTLPLIALAFAAAMPAAAVAQEQENPSTPGQIPDPSTYQGSQVLQQQSDQQDQQFRQQQQEQQQQSAPQNGGQYSGGNNSSRSYSQAPSLGAQCMLMVTRSLTPLRGLLALPGSSLDDPHYFTISRRPSAAEKTVLMRWLAGRRRCTPLMTWNPNPVVKQAELGGNQYTTNLIAALARGQMTYGEFSYRRAQKYAAVMRIVNSH